MAGKIIWLRLRSGSAVKPTKSPEFGRMPKTTDSTRMMSVPSQKFGSVIPISANSRASKSTSVSRLTADRMPIGTPTISAITNERSVSSRVSGKLRTISANTGCPLRTEKPRSPRSAAAIQRKYCSTSGLSSP